MRFRNLVFVFVSLLFLFSSSLAMAINSIQTLNEGDVYVESYNRVNNMGRGDVNISNYVALSFGINDDFYFWGALSQASRLKGLIDPQISSTVGLGATAIRSAVFEMDVMLDFSVYNIGKDAYYLVNPSFEFNFDADPNMMSWGIYVRVGMPMYVVEDIDALGEGIDKHRVQMDLKFILGAYYRINDTHRILIQESVSVHDFSKEYTLDPLALGYNIYLRPDLTLLTELSFTLPVNDESFGVNCMLGFMWML